MSIFVRGNRQNKEEKLEENKVLEVPSVQEAAKVNNHADIASSEMEE